MSKFTNLLNYRRDKTKSNLIEQELQVTYRYEQSLQERQYLELIKQKSMDRSSQEFTYEMQLKQIEEEIKKEEMNIAELEDEYLRRTKFCGNFMTGFKDYFLFKNFTRNDVQEFTIYPEDRIFSLSSITSEASKQYSQLNRIPNKRGRRLTRSKNKSSFKKNTKHSKFTQSQDSYEQEIQRIQMQEQLSIQSQQNSQGSLNKKPIQFQEQHVNKPQLNISDTISENSLINSQTLSIVEVDTRSKKKTKKPELNTNIKRWFNRQKKKSQSLLQNQEYLYEIHGKQGICTLDQLKKHGQMQKEKDKGTHLKKEKQNQDLDSCDSVKKFIKMACRKRNN